MLSNLFLENLILVESCQVPFEKGFNVISGETGAGKTALIEGIALILGQRSDTSKIRLGSAHATVEATFEIDLKNVSIARILDDNSITSKASLVIRREITQSGKNRSWINEKLVSNAILQQLGVHLIDLVDQHAHLSLRNLEIQRQLLDLFSDTLNDIALFQSSWMEEKKIQEKLLFLTEQNQLKQREIPICLDQLKELEQFSLKDYEEKKEDEEFRRLLHAQEIVETLQIILQGCFESDEPLFPLLNQYSKQLEKMKEIDSSLAQPAHLFSEILIHLKESQFHLQSYLNSFSYDEQRFVQLEKKLKAIDRLKKKYGKNFEEILAYKRELIAKIDRFEHLDEELESVVTTLQKIKNQTQMLAQKITEKRSLFAKKLETLLNASLHTLNLPDAEIKIERTAQERSNSGEDIICFWLKANKGEPFISVKEHASGGELARLFFALKWILTSRYLPNTMIFDEIDANIGGETAHAFGLKLKKLGKQRQVICITHFPQVAAQADHHLNVYKQESDGRTISVIRTLSSKQKEKELLRMLGGVVVK